MRVRSRAEVTYPAGDGRHATAALRPGTVDDEARRFYGHAACAPLAAALHDITGWDFLVVCKATGRDDGWHEACHAAVTSQGVVLDIDGVSFLADVLGRWENEHGPALPVITGTLDEFGYPEPDENLIAVTSAFAESLVRGCGLED
jgi:hypothetical protein